MNKISFGNYESFLLDLKNKHLIIDYLYNNINLLDFIYNILNIISKLKFLKENIFNVSGNNKGINYLLLMLTINNEKICVVINRKQLSYHKNKLDMNNLKILKINIDINNFYNDTILDCKLINKNTLLIQDCFYLSGNNITNLDLESKLDQLKNIINNLSSKNCNFELIKIYNYSDLDKLVSEVKNNTNDFNGLIFYPKKSGVNIIYINENNENITINDNNNLALYKNNIEFKLKKEENSNNNLDYINVLLNRNYPYYHGNKIENYWIGKTSIPDVYNVYINEKELDPLGIACIPNLKISKLCDQLINEKLEKFECIYVNKFKKWMPIKKL